LPGGLPGTATGADAPGPVTQTRSPFWSHATAPPSARRRRWP